MIDHPTAPSVFDTPPPRLSAERLSAIAAEHFGITGQATPLVSERDQNARLDAGADRYVLKIANTAEDRRLLTLQTAVLEHIAAVDPALGVPRVVRTRTGADIVEVDGEAGRHAARLMSFLPGRLYSEAGTSPELLASLGAFMGRLTRALQGFGHPAAFRPDFLWNLDSAPACERYLGDIAVAEQRAIVARVFERYRRHVAPRLPKLRSAVVHQDANDNNLIVADDGRTVTGLVDFGDLCFGRQVNELAVTLAYALLGQHDILAAARQVIGGYVAEFPITADEAEVLFDLVAMRLAMSVCISSHRGKAHPDNPYLLISQQPAFALLARLDRINPAFAAAFARKSAEHPAVATSAAVERWLSSPQCRPAALFDIDLDRAPRLIVELQKSSPGMQHAGDPVAYWRWLEARMQAEGAAFGIGLYGEDRDVYKGPQFESAATGGWRSTHLGIDIFIAAGMPLHAPLDGVVVSVVDNAEPYDYGPTIILEHCAGEGGPAFFTLYGHLGRDCLAQLRPGQSVAAGERIGTIGDHTINGGWAPHLHFQVMTDRLGQSGNWPGVGEPELMDVWGEIVPDPNLLLKLAPESFATDPAPPAVLLDKRAGLLGPSLSISYRRKLKIVRGRDSYLYDHTGRAFLDCVNNICHVGHSHPRVVEALARQAAVLNTNTRYLHDNILAYAEQLTAHFPKPLSVVFMVCSGSEANELALRMARTVTGRRDVVCLDWGYHGNTGNLIDVSPYKFNRKGGRGKPEHVEIATLPDPYRGPFKGYGEDAGRAYARSVEDCIETIRARTGAGPAAFIAEAISGCGGQVMFPQGYLREAIAAVRASGGLAIVDEVQTGFGRVGSHFWAHELQDGAVPDIVTLGKPIGNGHPMAAVVTTPDIARAFANGMEFFSSFGGNPVSAAVGLAVLDVIRDERLQDNARLAGAHLKARLEALRQRHPLIGDVRGEGLFLGVELVRDRQTLTPATAEAGDIANALREAGVLISTDGPDDNVLKIKPPICFGLREADLLADALDTALGALA